MSKNKQNNTNPPRSKWRKAALAAAVTAGLLTAAPAMACFFGGVVFDPSNFVEHIFEASTGLQEIARMENQLQNQERMLAGLGTNAWPGMAQSMQGVTLVLQNGGRFTSSDPAGQMAAHEPLTFGDGTQNPDAGQMAALQTTWSQDNQAGIIQNRQLENQVVAGVTADAAQINEIVAASGRTAIAAKTNASASVSCVIDIFPSVFIFDRYASLRYHEFKLLHNPLGQYTAP
jgi:hypothetical protein